MKAIRELVESCLGKSMKSASPLSGGDIAEVIKILLTTGLEVVVKRSRPGTVSTTRIEARMLEYLAQESALPVPKVLHVDDQNLLLEFIAGAGTINTGVEANAADHIARLHGVTGNHFGFDEDTVIGPLRQPNPPATSWCAFFRDQRLLFMAEIALKANRLDRATFDRIQRFAGELGNFIDEPEAPALLHGDLWGGNVIANNGKVAAFIDPAIYFGHPEMDLAFATLFGSFVDSFFRAYNEQRPIEPGFFEVRRGIYNLWPLLVHVRLFGGDYLAQVKSILSRLGY